MRVVILALLCALACAQEPSPEQAAALKDTARACLKARRAAACPHCDGRALRDCDDCRRGCEACKHRGEARCEECVRGIEDEDRAALREDFGYPGDPLAAYKRSRLTLTFHDASRATTTCPVKLPGREDYLEEASDWVLTPRGWRVINVRDGDDPEQWPTDREEWEAAGFTITPLMSYTIAGKVLGVRAYEDDAATLLPLDLALAWGSAASAEVATRTVFSQSDRWYHWRFENLAWELADQIPRRSANLHIAPATPALTERLLALEPGRRVRLEGYLIRAVKRRRFFVSSLSRRDRDDGSCEVLWVEALEVE